MKFYRPPAATLFALVAGCLALAHPARSQQAKHTGPQTDGLFRKVIVAADETIDGKLADTLKDPMELAVAPDGRVFYAQRDGTVKLTKPGSKESIIIAKLAVFTGLEDGLLGITLDPNFAKNNWVYLNRSLPDTFKDDNGEKAGKIRVARFTLDGDKLDPASEKVIIEMQTQREQCCHVGGSLAFDKDGNLFVSIGDNTNPFDSDGYSPGDDRPGRRPWDAQRTAANANSLVGKILRVTPKTDGGYEIPKGNLFAPGTVGTRPEIYVMGNRNPFRISVDPKNSYLYWGEVGPDANGLSETRGPAGADEINQARKPGFYGWPLFVGDNKAYAKIDFTERKSFNDAKSAYDKSVKEAATKKLPKPEPFTKKFPAGEVTFHNAEKPINSSANNTGIKELPPTQPAFIHYTHGQSARFPVVNAGGGRTAMAGPVYYFDKSNKSATKLPAEFDHTLFIYEWSRNWIIAVHLDADDNIAKNADGSWKMERFCPNMTFKRPMDMELGADGCLYLIEWGSAWGNNLDTQIVRIEYTGSANTAAK